MTVGRFAPSPTGRMHLGNVMCALLSWLHAKAPRPGINTPTTPTWRLRIEDLDPQRSKHDFALQLMDDLQWLGLSWDGEVVWQSQRHDIYQHYLDHLVRSGQTYHCSCTRADLLASSAPHQSDGRTIYPGTCRDKGLTQGAIRLRVPDYLQQHCGDFILRRRDGAWAYQLAVVVDDGLMGITDVVRGNDLLSSVPQQEYLYSQLSLPAPHFHHHPLLCNNTGQRLCKRDKSLDMSELRKHHTPQQIIGRIAHLCHLTPEYTPLTPQQLLPLYDWDKIPTHNIIIP